MDAKKTIEGIAVTARQAAGVLAMSNGAKRNAALMACAAAIRAAKATLQTENEKDLARSDEMGLSEAMIDRLRLTDDRIEGMAVALEQITAQTDPVGQTISASNRPNGLRIKKHRIPIRVIGIIFESRPNVTTNTTNLYLKNNNACILRGGKEAIHSNLAIAAALQSGLKSASLPAGCITVLKSTDREMVPAMATAEGLIDLIIPRGGASLIHAVTEAATIPVIKHYSGNCHVYIHSSANAEMASEIIINAKTQRPGVCNAAETLLIDAPVAKTLLPQIAQKLIAAGVELRGCQLARTIVPEIKPATDTDWGQEYLDLILAVKVVDDLDAAARHINKYGSKHTDAIVTDDISAAARFTDAVDTSSVMINASTRFSDGGQYGLGAEIGISTDKLHARGPMGAQDLTTYKWVVTGRGHVRN